MEVIERKRHRENDRVWEQKQKKLGLCIKCNSPATNGLLCKIHKGKQVKRQNNYRHKHKSLGLCYSCNKPRLPNTIYCAYHYYKHLLHMKRHHIKHQLQDKEYSKQRYEKLKLERKCKNCAIPLIEGEGVMCINCRTVANQGNIVGVGYEIAD